MRDSRGTLMNSVAEDLAPQSLDRRNLREEAVPAQVEAERLVLHRPRDAADHLIGLEDGDPGVGRLAST